MTKTKSCGSIIAEADKELAYELSMTPAQKNSKTVPNLSAVIITPKSFKCWVDEFFGEQRFLSMMDQPKVKNKDIYDTGNINKMYAGKKPIKPEWKFMMRYSVMYRYSLDVIDKMSPGVDKEACLAAVQQRANKDTDEDKKRILELESALSALSTIHDSFGNALELVKKREIR